ncbi:uncharacterized protein J3R85_004954 [Psidium guajava]|nr:uncharacterized protein J3R85_004954 [Psidium guajava]
MQPSCSSSRCCLALPSMSSPSSRLPPSSPSLASLASSTPRRRSANHEELEELKVSLVVNSTDLEVKPPIVAPVTDGRLHELSAPLQVSPTLSLSLVSLSSKVGGERLARSGELKISCLQRAPRSIREL